MKRSRQREVQSQVVGLPGKPSHTQTWKNARVIHTLSHACTYSCFIALRSRTCKISPKHAVKRVNYRSYVYKICTGTIQYLHVCFHTYAGPRWQYMFGSGNGVCPLGITQPFLNIAACMPGMWGHKETISAELVQGSRSWGQSQLPCGSLS